MKRRVFFILLNFIVNFSIFSALENDISVVDNRLEKLETLDLTELVNVSLSSDLGHRQANILYKLKYGDIPVQITYFVNDIAMYRQTYNIHISHKIVEDFLKAFGSSIEKLWISFIYLHKDILIENGRLVNLYCSETLKEFQARHFTEGAFVDYQQPFKKVENVIIDGTWQELRENSLKPNKLFPVMRRLDLTYSDGVVFDYNYPHLIEVKINNAPSTTGFIKFIENNPQIRKLYFQAPCPMDILKAVNDNLLKLDVFEFHYPNDFMSFPYPVIHLNNIKNATIVDKQLNIRFGNLIFKGLESLHLTVTGNLDDAWINFIVGNKQLRTLTAGLFSNSSLSTLSSNLNSLVEVNLSCNESVEVQSIQQLVENNPQMKKITLNLLVKGTVGFFDSLSEKLKDKWNASIINKCFSTICFTKSKMSSNDTVNNENLMESSPQNVTGNIQVDANYKNSTQNATQSGNNPDNKAHAFSSTILTVTLAAIIGNILTVL